MWFRVMAFPFGVLGAVLSFVLGASLAWDGFWSDAALCLAAFVLFVVWSTVPPRAGDRWVFGGILLLACKAVLAGLILSRPFALMCAKACGVLCVVALFAGWSKTSMRLAVGSSVCVLFWWLCQRLAVTCRRGFGRPR